MRHKIITILRIIILAFTAADIVYICGWKMFIKPFFDLYAAYMMNAVTGGMIAWLVVKVILAIPLAIVLAWSGYTVQEVLGIYGE